MKRLLTFVLSLLLLLSFASCGKKDKNGGKLKIVATIFPQYDIARTIAGDKAEVAMLLPWGSESHGYDPSVKDITAVSEADVFLYTGDMTEPWAATLLKNAESDADVPDILKGITLIEGNGEHSADGDHSADHVHDYDPHVWTSPKNAMIMTDNILAALCNADPDNADYYRKNAESLQKELEELDRELEELSENSSGRTLYFGGRFAFIYMFSDYGFRYASAYKGCSEESEPSIKVVSELCSAMEKDGAKYLFTEEMSEGKVAKGIAEETGADLLELHSCHNLSSEDAKKGETYISVMKRNIANIGIALENK